MKSTKNNIELVPFDAMPKNLPELLTRSDYFNALLNPSGFLCGIFEVIHFNTNHPQWHNIKLDEDDTEMMIYTKDGWHTEKFKNILRIFDIEYITCFLYVYNNKETVLGIHGSLENDIDINIPEGMKFQDCIKFPEGIKLPEGVIIPECMKIPKGTKIPEGLGIPKCTKNYDGVEMSTETTNSNQKKISEHKLTKQPIKKSTKQSIGTTKK